MAGTTYAADLAAYIDHTSLRPQATPEMIELLCKEALQYRFYAVCINPCYVPLAVSFLKGTEIKVCSVIGFPLGAATSRNKRAEAEEALLNGAAEVDMVLNTGLLLSGRAAVAKADIEEVVKAVKPAGLLKVILETGILQTESKIIEACRICSDAGADFVKTCTGFGTGEARAEHVRLMKGAVAPNMKVKASGGIRDRATAMVMIEAGASRIGTSAGVAIVAGLVSNSNY